MINLKYFLALSLSILFLFSCSDDEPVSCSRENFIGTFEGTQYCDWEGAEIESVQFKIEAGTMNDEIILTDVSLPEAEQIPITATVDGCKMTVDNEIEIEGFLITFKGEGGISSDGSGLEFSITETNSYDGQVGEAYTCTTTLSNEP